MSASFVNALSFPANASTVIMNFLDETDNRPIEESTYRKNLETTRKIENIVYNIFAGIVINNSVTTAIFLGIGGVLFSFENKYLDLLISREIFNKISEPEFTAQIKEYRFMGTNILFEKQALSCLKKITQSGDVAIVLSSARRYGITVSKSRTICQASFGNLIIDSTPERSDREYILRMLSRIKFYRPLEKIRHKILSRAAEIQDWLDRHPTIKNYVIIDDRNDQLLENFHERFVHVDFNNLLTESDAEKAIQILKQHTSL